MTAAVRIATYEDVLQAPEHCIAQLVGGTLDVQPRPAGPHAYTASGLGADLGGPFQRGRGGPGGWLILYEPELHLGGDVLVPDLAGWRAARAPALDQAHFSVAPDWVGEVLSPRTAAFDRGPKADAYAAAGVAYLWLIDPLEQLLEAYRLSDAEPVSASGRAWVRLGAWSAEAVVEVPPFEAVPLALGPLWVPRGE